MSARAETLSCPRCAVDDSLTPEARFMAACSRFLAEYKAPEPEADPLYTLAQAAEYLNADASWIGRLCKAGQIKSIRDGRYVRVRRSALEDWTRRRTNASRVSHLTTR